MAHIGRLVVDNVVVDVAQSELETREEAIEILEQAADALEALFRR